MNIITTTVSSCVFQCDHHVFCEGLRVDHLQACAPNDHTTNINSPPPSYFIQSHYVYMDINDPVFCVGVCEQPLVLPTGDVTRVDGITSLFP